MLGCAADGAGAATTGGIDPAPLLASALQDRRRGRSIYLNSVHISHTLHMYPQTNRIHKTMPPHPQPPRWRWRCSGSRER